MRTRTELVTEFGEDWQVTPQRCTRCLARAYVQPWESMAACGNQSLDFWPEKEKSPGNWNMMAGWEGGVRVSDSIKFL